MGRPGLDRRRAHIELYDSGSTRHISPFKERFESLSTIPPKSFTAANKQSFHAEVGYTLVSIGRLDELGYSATFADGKCTLCDSAEEIVGQIPRTSKGLYRVVHDASSGSVHAALETVTVMELHRRMGHIAPSAARRLDFVSRVSMPRQHESPSARPAKVNEQPSLLERSIPTFGDPRQ